jgi:P-type Cu+ transporter
MHREVSHADEVFGQSRGAGLYLLTALLALLIGRDLVPYLWQWLGPLDLFAGAKPPSRELLGFRYALIAAVIGGARVLYYSIDALFEGRLVADLTIAVAVIAAILLGEPLVAAEVIFIGLAGECLEAFTFARTQRGVRKLVEVFPQRCWVSRDGVEVRIFTNEVRAGERVVVKPGGKVPVDGIVVEGRSAVDASPLTGESLPLDRGPGDEVLAGSINQFGQLIIEARRVAEQTVAGRVIELTARALRDKAPVQRQVDRLARWFLPAVLAAAVVVFVLNLAYQLGPFQPAEARLSLAAAARLSVYPTLGVLVVACPCALLLATPAVMIAALGRLAGTGVLLKGSSALERLAQAQAFAFDKTGTLTEGRVELGDVIALDGASADDVLGTAASAEQGSEHPLGLLLVREAFARELPLLAMTDFEAHPGAGVAALCGAARLLVGTRRLLEEQGVAISPEAATALAHLDEKGQSSLLVVRDGSIIGAIGARDRIRADAADVLQELRNAGIKRIALLTGDRTAVARAVAETLKIDEVYAELLPTDKEARVTALTAKTVCFVGDGINDAPALARASVGIAVGGGADVAAEAGDIVMMGEPLRHLPLLLRLSRETMRIIRQNIIVYAFGVNLAGIVLTGLLWPLFATSPDLFDKAPLVGVVYHQIGSLLVLLNSMRLLAFEKTAGRQWSRWGERYAAFDLWLKRGFHLDNLLHQLLHRWKMIAIALSLIAPAVWLASGCIVVGPDEVAVVQTFGRLQADLAPGLHWRWPWPIDVVRKVKPDEVKVVPIDFKPRTIEEDNDDPALAREDGATWTSVHASNPPLLFTGDRNLIQVLASVQFTIDSPRQYLFTARQPRLVIRSAAEGALREVVAGRSFMELLTTQRLDLQAQVALRLEQRLRALAPEGIGVRIAGVVVHDMHPPPEVARDYYRLAKAMQELEQRRHRANATAALIKSRAIEEEIAQVNQARRTANGIVDDARASTAELLGWQRARSQLSAEESSELLDQFLGAMESGQNISEAIRAWQMEQQRLVERRRAMLDFSLVWNALAVALQGRDKVIIDAEQVRGKMQLFIVDPELIRPAILVAPKGTNERP